MDYWSLDEFLDKQLRRVRVTTNNNFDRWKRRISKHVDDMEPAVIVRGSVGSDAHPEDIVYTNFPALVGRRTIGKNT